MADNCSQSKAAPVSESRPEKTLGNATLPKLAYSMAEAAQVLGVSYITIHRLIKRGLLRASTACRTKIIPVKELERFLVTTLG